MRLIWSSHALADRDRIFDYISADNPRAAVAVDLRIAARVEDLTAFPSSGRPGRVAGTRELVITGTPYITIYRTGSGLIEVLRVLHGARLWPEP